MARKRKGNPIHGWINLDKPQGLTSTQGIGRIRRVLSPEKIGHAGTLDPLATGILPIAMGDATKIIPFVQDADKTYSFTVKWGEATDSDDSEGEVIKTSDRRPTHDEIKAVLPAFIGEIEQIPPKYSAIKINGERAYDLARAGKDVEIKSRIVSIYSLELLSAEPNQASFLVKCGKGTYVRAIARDMAEKLGTYGHIIQLRREAVGFFTLKNAISLELLEKMDHSAALEEVVMPLQEPLDDIPALPLTEKEASQLKNGQNLVFSSRQDFHRLEGLDDDLVIAELDGMAVALVEKTKAILKPVRVFNQ
ncbi:MAG: tRNA pseudouridine(55) synthase TruB [Alphaproteobacteria bacterium]